MTDQKVIFITGGGNGLGLATTKHMLSLGHTVIVADISLQNVEKHPNLMISQTDVTSESAVKDAMSQAVHRFGRIDVAIPCAGI